MEDSLVLPTGQHYEEDTLMPILQRIMKKGKEVKENEERMKRGIFDFCYDAHKKVLIDALEHSKQLRCHLRREDVLNKDIS